MSWVCKTPLLDATISWRVKLTWVAIRLHKSMLLAMNTSINWKMGCILMLCLNVSAINWKMDGILFLMMHLCLFVTIWMFSWRIELKNWLKSESASMLMKSWHWKSLKTESDMMLLKSWCWRSLKYEAALTLLWKLVEIQIRNHSKGVACSVALMNLAQ